MKYCRVERLPRVRTLSTLSTLTEVVEGRKLRRVGATGRGEGKGVDVSVPWVWQSYQARSTLKLLVGRAGSQTGTSATDISLSRVKTKSGYL